MDEQLAAIYGTGASYVEETDLEKTAAAELLVKLAEEQGVDLANFSDEEVGEMLNDLYAGGVEHTAAAEPSVDDEAQEKFAEADYLGRIMAHSMVQELDSIEKEAGKVGDAAGKVWGALKGGGSKAKETAGKAWGGVKGRAQEAKSGVTGWSSAGRSGGKMKLTPGERLQNLKPAAKVVGGAAALEGARRLGKSQKTASADSAIDQLAAQRAFDMAKEAGYIDEQGNFLVETEKQASALDLAIERRALEICESEGIPVDWNE